MATADLESTLGKLSDQGNTRPLVHIYTPPVLSYKDVPLHTQEASAYM